MDGGQITAIIIVAIIMIASIVKATMKHSHQYMRAQPDERTQVENRHLRSEVSELKERIKVLERIAVDKENSLAKEIESLRDR
ncbi:MAG TPA: hypothetical protein VH392_08090 [Sphingomicrobium sp.]|jgi:uncharacterized protein YlxW (UPF0749 family)